MRQLPRVPTLVEQVKAAVTALERDPRDPVARGSLAEATAKLDELGLSMTDHDRLRLEGLLSREVWIDEPRKRFLNPLDPPLPP